MIDGYFVIDGIAHAYNFDPGNVQDGRLGSSLLKMMMDGFWWGSGPGDGNASVKGGGVGGTLSKFKFDWQIDQLACAEFLESDVDMATTHTLALNSWFKDGLCRPEKTVEAVTKYPSRFLGYVGVDPTAGIDVAIAEFDRQLAMVSDEARKNIVGLKLYPAQADTSAPVGYRSFRMDDPEVAFPLFERALEAGLKSVAIHKAAPLGVVPMNPYRVDDVSGAAAVFPDLAFEIVHAGLAFSQETAVAMAQYPNVYGLFETTCRLAVTSPKQFEAILAEMIYWAGPAKVIFGTAGNIPGGVQDILEAWTRFQFSDDVCEGWGISKLTREDRQLMLAGNYARIVGLDLSEARAGIEVDSFSARRAEAGGRLPDGSTWSVK